MTEQIYGGKYVSIPSKLPRDRPGLRDAPFPYQDPSLEEAVSKRRIYVRAKNKDHAALLMLSIYQQRKSEWIPEKERSKESIVVVRYVGTLKELGVRHKVKVREVE